MKRIILPFLILAILLFSCSLQAENDYFHSNLQQALQKQAELFAENIVFVSEIEGEVTVPPGGESFEEVLAELLAGTPYDFTYQAGYYLIGEFERSSGSYAQAAKSELYRAEHLSALRLKEMLTSLEVEVLLIPERDYLQLRGLPRKIEEALDLLQEIDREHNPYQVIYRLTVIDITEEREFRRVLSRAELSAEKDEESQFIARNDLLELTGPEIMEELKLKLQKSARISEKIARPVLVTELGETGRIALSEKIIVAEIEKVHEHMLAEESIMIEVTPGRVDKVEGRVATEVRIETGGTSGLKTSTWIDSGEEILLGLMSLEQSSRTGTLVSDSSRESARQFAVYLTGTLKGTLTGTDSTGTRVGHPGEEGITETGGLDSLLWDRSGEIYQQARPDRYQLMLDASGNFDAEIFWQGLDGALAVEALSRQGREFLSLEIGYSLIGDLRLSSRAMLLNNGNVVLGPGLTDRSRISQNLIMGVGYFPAVYNFNTGNWFRNYILAELEYHLGPAFLNLRYSPRFEPELLQLQAGVNLAGPLTLVGGIAGDFEGISRYLFGVRMEL